MENAPHTAGRSGRPRLTREAVVAAAVDLADRHGLEAVTMREVGAALGVEAMSLYRHVESKSALLDATVESVWAAVDIAPPEAHWRDGIRITARATHRALLAHTWVFDTIDSSGGPPRFAMMDALLGCLTRAGLSPSDVYEGYHLLDALILGYTLQERNYASLPAATLDAQLERIPPDLAHLNEHVQRHLEPGGGQEPSGFDLGLELLLDALAARIPAR